MIQAWQELGLLRLLVPHSAVTTPRRVALPLIPKVQMELERLEEQGVISRVEERTDW